MQNLESALGFERGIAGVRMACDAQGFGMGACGGALVLGRIDFRGACDSD